MVRRLIFNVLDNTVKCAAPGSVVHVELRQKVGTYTITVSNVGAAIRQDAQAHIFERFLGAKSPTWGVFSFFIDGRLFATVTAADRGGGERERDAPLP